MKHLEALFERALDAVVGMDANGNVIAWNLAAQEIFGWTRAAAMGRAVNDLIVPPQYRDAHAQGLIHYHATGEGPVLQQRVNITAMTRDGQEFPVELSILPMPEQDAKTTFYAFIRSLAREESFRREQVLRAMEADTLLKIGQKLIEEVPLEDFTRFCLDEVCKIAGLEAAHMFIMRGRGTARRLEASGIWHMSDPRFRPVMEQTAAMQFRLGQGLPGRAWEAGRLLAIDDLSQDQRFARREAFSEVGLTRAVAIPVLHAGETRIVLEFFGTAASRLDPEILRMLTTVGSQIGAAVVQRETAENRETLRREMMHRVGNSLTILSSIYRSCSRAATTKEELDEAFLGRVTAMGEANRMAIIEAKNGLALPRLLMDALAILPDPDRVSLEAPDIRVDSENVMPLSLVFNELATNALKYGQLADDGHLAIRAVVSEDGTELVVEWHETGSLTAVPQDNGDVRVGFGTRLIKAMVENRLAGSFKRRQDNSGFHFAMRLPLSRLVASQNDI